MDGHSAVLDARPANAAEHAAWRPTAVPHPLAGFDLTSQVALVTGARRGIRRAIATALAAQEASVVVHHADGSEEAEDAAQVLADIRALGGRSTTLAADFSQTGAGTRLAQGAPAITRRLLAAVHADIVGFSRLVEQDDLGSLARLQLLRKELVMPLLRHHGGHLVNAAGDALLLVFESVTNAVTFALDMQAGMRCNERARAEASRIRYRIGIHIGDVIMSDGDVCGDGVNIASRLQACCPPNGVCVSRAVLDIVQTRLMLAFAPLGVKTFRNISVPVETFALEKGVDPTLMLVAKSATLSPSPSPYPLIRSKTSAKPGLVNRRTCERKANTDFATSINVESAPIHTTVDHPPIETHPPSSSALPDSKASTRAHATSLRPARADRLPTHRALPRVCEPPAY